MVSSLYPNDSCRSFFFFFFAYVGFNATFVGRCILSVDLVEDSKWTELVLCFGKCMQKWTVMRKWKPNVCFNSKNIDSNSSPNKLVF